MVLDCTAIPTQEQRWSYDSGGGLDWENTTSSIKGTPPVSLGLLFVVAFIFQPLKIITSVDFNQNVSSSGVGPWDLVFAWPSIDWGRIGTSGTATKSSIPLCKYILHPCI